MCDTLRWYVGLPSIIHPPLVHVQHLFAPRFLLFLIRSTKAVASGEERTGSVAASRGRRGWTSLVVFTLPPPGQRGAGGEDEELALGGRSRNVFSETSHIDTSYSRVSCWQWKRRDGVRTSDMLNELLGVTGCLLLSHRAGCRTLSPQWSVGTGGGRSEAASGWSDIGTFREQRRDITKRFIKTVHFSSERSTNSILYLNHLSFSINRASATS